MWAIITCMFIVAMGVSVYVFSLTEAGKRFFDDEPELENA